MLRALLLLCVLLTPAVATAADVKCYSPGVAQFVIPDLLSHNPGAQKLGIEVNDVRLLWMDGEACVVEVAMTTAAGTRATFKYKFRLDASGAATIDMIP